MCRRKISCYREYTHSLGETSGFTSRFRYIVLCVMGESSFTTVGSCTSHAEPRKTFVTAAESSFEGGTSISMYLQNGALIHLIVRIPPNDPATYS